jgi:hypothetical protein
MAHPHQEEALRRLPRLLNAVRICLVIPAERPQIFECYPSYLVMSVERPWFGVLFFSILLPLRKDCEAFRLPVQPSLDAPDRCPAINATFTKKVH